MNIQRYTPSEAPDPVADTGPDTEHMPGIDMDELSIPKAIPAKRVAKQGRRVALVAFLGLLVLPLLLGLAAMIKSSSIVIPPTATPTDVTPLVGDVAASALDLWIAGDDLSALSLPGVRIDPFVGNESLTVLSHSRFERIPVEGPSSTRLLELNEFLLRDGAGTLFDVTITMEVFTSVPGQQYGLLISAPSLLPRISEVGPTKSFSRCDTEAGVQLDAGQSAAIGPILAAIYGPVEGSEQRFRDATFTAEYEFDAVSTVTFVPGSERTSCSYVRPDTFTVASVSFSVLPLDAGPDAEPYSAALDLMISPTGKSGRAFVVGWGAAGTGPLLNMFESNGRFTGTAGTQS
jgi:hypothetical protein